MPVCVECGVSVPKVVSVHAWGCQLDKCPVCGCYVDKYIEVDAFNLYIHTILKRPSAYRHILHNVNYDSNTDNSFSSGNSTAPPQKTLTDFLDFFAAERAALLRRALRKESVKAAPITSAVIGKSLKRRTEDNMGVRSTVTKCHTNRPATSLGYFLTSSRAKFCSAVVFVDAWSRWNLLMTVITSHPSTTSDATAATTTASAAAYEKSTAVASPLTAAVCKAKISASAPQSRAYDHRIGDDLDSGGGDRVHLYNHCKSDNFFTNTVYCTMFPLGYGHCDCRARTQSHTLMSSRSHKVSYLTPIIFTTIEMLTFIIVVYVLTNLYVHYCRCRRAPQYTPSSANSDLELPHTSATPYIGDALQKCTGHRKVVQTCTGHTKVVQTHDGTNVNGPAGGYSRGQIRNQARTGGAVHQRCASCMGCGEAPPLGCRVQCAGCVGHKSCSRVVSSAVCHGGDCIANGGSSGEWTSESSSANGNSNDNPSTDVNPCSFVTAAVDGCQVRSVIYLYLGL
eukprot:Lankesteria_metandrocarpae@DN3162_c0_g1_i1.p1